MEWARIVASGVGLLINWAVFHKSRLALSRIMKAGLNGQTQRDARWALWDDGTLTMMQVVVFTWGMWLAYMPAPRPEVAEHLEVSCWMIIALSVLISTMGIRNLRLRQLHVSEYIARKKGYVRTRLSDTACE